MYKLVIFDLDGTLINSVADLADSTNFALENCGFPTHPTDAYRYFVGRGIDKLLENALPENERSKSNIFFLRSVMLPHYSTHCTNKTTPYSGIENLLQQLSKSGIQIAIASNKYQAATIAMVKYFFPDIPFAAILGQRDGFPTKPNPAIVQEILDLVQVERTDVLYVGDTSIDMQTAKNAEIDVVGVTWGFRPRTELEPYLPNFIIDKAEEILEIINSVKLKV